MRDDDKTFDRIRDYLWSRPCGFCVVYRLEKSLFGVKLKWCKAISLVNNNQEEYKKLAATYQEVAEQCYHRNRVYILKESVPRPNSKTRRWCGFTISEKGDLPPANSEGRRWWQFVIGAGPVRNAGYVIVARVSAMDNTEVRDCVAQVQQIVKGSDNMKAV